MKKFLALERWNKIENNPDIPSTGYLSNDDADFQIGTDKDFTEIYDDQVYYDDVPYRYSRDYHTVNDTTNISISKKGNDSTGTGTFANPYLTLNRALLDVTVTKNTIIIKDNMIIDEQISLFDPNLKYIVAQNGYTPIITFTDIFYDDITTDMVHDVEIIDKKIFRLSHNAGDFRFRRYTDLIGSGGAILYDEHNNYNHFNYMEDPANIYLYFIIRTFGSMAAGGTNSIELIQHDVINNITTSLVTLYSTSVINDYANNEYRISQNKSDTIFSPYTALVRNINQSKIELWSGKYNTAGALYNYRLNTFIGGSSTDQTFTGTTFLCETFFRMKSRIVRGTDENMWGESLFYLFYVVISDVTAENGLWLFKYTGADSSQFSHTRILEDVKSVVASVNTFVTQTVPSVLVREVYERQAGIFSFVLNDILYISNIWDNTTYQFNEETDSLDAVYDRVILDVIELDDNYYISIEFLLDNFIQSQYDTAGYLNGNIYYRVVEKDNLFVSGSYYQKTIEQTDLYKWDYINLPPLTHLLNSPINQIFSVNNILLLYDKNDVGQYVPDRNQILLHNRELQVFFYDNLIYTDQPITFTGIIFSASYKFQELIEVKSNAILETDQVLFQYCHLLDLKHVYREYPLRLEYTIFNNIEKWINIELHLNKRLIEIYKCLFVNCSNQAYIKSNIITDIIIEKSQYFLSAGISFDSDNEEIELHENSLINISNCQPINDYFLSSEKEIKTRYSEYMYNNENHLFMKDPIFNFIGDGTTKDQSRQNKIPTISGTISYNTVTLNGESRDVMVFNSDYLQIPTSEYSKILGYTEFAVDFWARITNWAAVQVLFTYDGYQTGFALECVGPYTLRLWSKWGMGGGFLDVNWGADPGWLYITFSRIKNTNYCSFTVQKENNVFQNSSRVLYNNSNYNANTNGIWVGRRPDGSYLSSGFEMANLRFREKSIYTWDDIIANNWNDITERSVNNRPLFFIMPNDILNVFKENYDEPIKFESGEFGHKANIILNDTDEYDYRPIGKYLNSPITDENIEADFILCFPYLMTSAENTIETGDVFYFGNNDIKGELRPMPTMEFVLPNTFKSNGIFSGFPYSYLNKGNYILNLNFQSMVSEDYLRLVYLLSKNSVFEIHYEPLTEIFSIYDNTSITKLNENYKLIFRNDGFGQLTLPVLGQETNIYTEKQFNFYRPFINIIPSYPTTITKRNYLVKPILDSLKFDVVVVPDELMNEQIYYKNISIDFAIITNFEGIL